MTYDEAVAALGAEIAEQIAERAKAAPPMSEDRLAHLVALFSAEPVESVCGPEPGAA